MAKPVRFGHDVSAIAAASPRAVVGVRQDGRQAHDAKPCLLTSCPAFDCLCGAGHFASDTGVRAEAFAP